MNDQPILTGPSLTAPVTLYVLWVGDAALGQRFTARRAPHIQIVSQSAAAAVDLLQGNGDRLPDLLVVDATLPGVEPLQLLRLAGSDPVDLPVVLLTQPGQDDLIAQAEGLAVCDAVVKTPDFVHQLLPAFTQVRARHDVLAVLRSTRQSEERFRAILELQPAVTCLVKPDGYIMAMNQAGIGLLAATREHVVGRPFVSLLPPDEQEGAQEFIARVCAGESGIIEHSLIRADGTIARVRTEAVPLPRAEGNVALATLHEKLETAATPDNSVIDALVSERDRLADQLREAADQVDALRADLDTDREEWRDETGAAHARHAAALQELDAERTRLDQALRDAAEQAAAVHRDAEHDRDQLAQALQSATIRCESLAADFYRAEGASRDAQAKLQREANTIKNLTAERDRVRAELEQLQEENQSATGHIEAERDRMRAELEQAHQARQSATSHIEAERDRMRAELEQAHQERQSATSHIETDRDRTSQALQALQAQSDAASTEWAAERSQWTAERSQWHDRAQHSLAEQTAIVDALSLERDRATAALQSANGRCEALADQLQHVERELRQAELRVQTTDAQAQQAEAQRLYSQAQTEQTEARVQQADARAHQAEVRAREAEAKTLQAETRFQQQAETQAREAEARITKAEARARQAEERIQHAENWGRQADERATQAHAAARDLEAAHAHAGGTARQLQEERDHHLRALQDLQLQHDAVAMERERVGQSLRSATIRCEELSGQLQQMDALLRDADAARAQQRDAEAKWATERAEWTSQLQQIEAEQAQIRADRDALVERLHRAEAAARELEAERAQVGDAARLLQDERDRNAQQLHTVRAEHKTAELRWSEERAQWVERAKQSHDTHMSVVDAIAAERDQLLKKLKSATTQSEALEDAIRHSDSGVKESMGRQAQDADTIALLNADIRAFGAQRNRLTRELDDARAHHAAVEQAWTVERARGHEAEKALAAEQQARLDALQQTVDALHEQRQELKHALAQATTRVDALAAEQSQARAAAAAADVEKVTRELRDTEARCEHLVAEMSRARTAQAQAEAQLAAEAEEVANARHRVATLDRLEARILSDQQGLAALRQELLRFLCDADIRVKALSEQRDETLKSLDSVRDK